MADWPLALHEDDAEAAVLLAQLASAGKGTSLLIDLLALAGLVAAASLLCLPDGLLDGFTAALLVVHFLELLAALLKVLLLGVGGGHLKDFLLHFLAVVWAAALLKVALAGTELAALHLLAALVVLLAALSVVGSGGDGGGVGGGAGDCYQGHQKSCCECYLVRHCMYGSEFLLVW